MRKDTYQSSPSQQNVLTKNKYSSINLWSTVNHDILSHRYVMNTSDGYLDAQRSTNYVSYYKSSKKKVHQRILKRILAGYCGETKMFIIKKKDENWLTLYIDSNQ